MIELKHVSKIYSGTKRAVDDFNLTIEPGEFVCFIGTSGSGKTTTMRMINRMEELTEGQILINGVDIMDQDPVELRRSIGYVIQNVGLMPHMTIKENITLVPKLLNWSEEEKDKIAKKMIRMAELPEEFLDRYPSQLSGGQQQRIGVVRALAADQDIILMDEPFGALDPITRLALQDLVKHLQEELGKTIVFVTHDMDEALKLATRIVVMDHGKIVQVATPDELVRNPANQFVEDFLGPDRLIQPKQDVKYIKEVMNPEPITIRIDQSLTEALEVMYHKRVDTLLVVDNGYHLKGMVDVQKVQNMFHQATSVSDVYRSNIYALNENALIRESIELILNRSYAYIPIVDDKNKLVGIVTRSTLVDIVYDAIWGNQSTDALETAVEVSDE